MCLNECVKERKELDQRTGMAAQTNEAVISMFIPVVKISLLQVQGIRMIPFTKVQFHEQFAVGW